MYIGPGVNSKISGIFFLLVMNLCTGWSKKMVQKFMAP